VDHDTGPATPAPGHPPRRRYRRRELTRPDGTTLVLNGDGSIDLRATDGTIVQSWKPDDAGWDTQAFRFGIRAQERTIAPRGPDTGSDRPGF
jgi:hypothetical protein